MYCPQCGNKINDDAAFCSACGAPVAQAAAEMPTASGRAQQPGASSAARPTQAQQTQQTPQAQQAQQTPQAGYTSWEYARTSVKSDLAQVATDCYENLGFELTGAKTESARSTTTLSFRRSRKVRGKAQLVKLQRTMDDLIASIAGMEAEKTRKASLRALTLGIISALVLGVGMCCTMVWTNLMIPGIVIGVAGIAGCIGAWLLYRSTVAKESERIAPRIEAAYDSLATACEEAQAVLRAQATQA